MTYQYAVATVVIHTPEEEQVILRFIIFEDGTVFEFYGNFGSLRSHIIIDECDAKQIINMDRYTYSDIIISTYAFNILKTGIISQYIGMDNAFTTLDDNITYINPKYIKKVYVLTNDLGNIFIKRILNNEILYAEQETLERFNTYKNILLHI